MKRRSASRTRAWLWLAAASILLPVMSLPAYVPLRWAPGGVRGAWSAGRFPLSFYLNQATATGTPNLAAGSDASSAVRAALAAWQSVPAAEIRFDDLRLTAVDSARADGINVITMADTAANREILGGDSGAVALTRLMFDAATGEITESDILLNPMDRFSTNQAIGTYDLQAIVTHELGHALGCDHSPVQSDTMFPSSAPGEFSHRYLSADAMAFASITYPNRPRTVSMGEIAGKISIGGKGVFGASVTAINVERNLIYAGLTESDGSFRINGAAAGRYTLYAEPLDGPATPDQLMIQGAEAYYQGLNATFRTVFSKDLILGIDGAPRSVTVNLSAAPGSATLNIDRMGRGDPESGIGYLEGGAVAVNPGERLSLWIGGANTWKAAGIGDVSILGDGVTIDPSRGLKALKSGYGQEVGISMLVQVSPDASPGPRTVVLKAGDQQVASTGGILVVPRSVPAHRLFFPYLQSTAEVYTGLALANAGTEIPASIKIGARDPAGALLWSEDATVPVDFALPGGSQSARLERQVFNLPLDGSFEGSVTVASDSPLLQGFFLTGDFGGTYLDGAEASSRGYRQLYFPDVVQNGHTVTEIHVMNTADHAADVDLLLVGQNGATLKGPVKRTIPAGGKIGASIAALFGYAGDLRSAHVRATATEDVLAGFGLIRTGPVGMPDAICGLNGLSSENAGSVLYAPQLAVGDLGLHYKTRLNVINIADSATTITVALLDEFGQELLPGIRGEELLPGAHFSVDAGSLFGLEKGQGYIRISGTESAKLIGNVIFGDGDPAVDRLTFGAALPLVAAGATEFVFAHLAQGLGFYTGVAMLAPYGAEVIVTAFDRGGSAIGNPAVFSLAPGQRLASLVKGLIPETDGQMGGYIRVSATQALIGFELFGTTDGQVLSAVPPQRIIQ